MACLNLSADLARLTASMKCKEGKKMYLINSDACRLLSPAFAFSKSPSHISLKSSDQKSTVVYVGSSKFCSKLEFVGNGRAGVVDSRGSQVVAAIASTPPFAGMEGSQLPQAFEPITSEQQMDTILAEAEAEGKSVIIDWMAQWCRKCIYLKPKIEKLASDYPKVRFCVVDVNAVPLALVKRGLISKMPTIQLWKHGEKVDEVIGAEKAWQVLDRIREMIAKAK